MSDTPSSATQERHRGSVELREVVSRYFFYGWLFRDADCGSSLERIAAWRHNRDQARWLPLYLWRWFVGAVVIAALEAMAEQVLGIPVLSAALSVLLILVAVFLVVTVVCWLFLKLGGDSR